MRRFLTLSAVIALLLMSSCKMVSSLLHDDDVVARVGKHELYRTELKAIVPSDLSPEDSARLAAQYINSWATDQLFLDLAEKELSKGEKNVSSQLEEYRRALLKFRYEQMFINERLDTAVSENEIQKYYEAHSDNFKLSIPIVRARFLRMSSDSPDLERVFKLMASSEGRDIAELDTLAARVADKYTDFGGEWVDMMALSREFGTDYGSLLSSVRNHAVSSESYGKVNYAYLLDILSAGTIPPVEYCTDRIKDAVLSARKQKLLSDLERDLLKDATANGNFERY